MISKTFEIQVKNRGALVDFVCPECKTGFTIVKETFCECKNQHRFAIMNGIYDFRPSTMHPITRSDAVYHDSVKEAYIDMHQINTYKNLYYRQQIQDFIKHHSDTQTNILEIGGGAGFDLQLCLKNGTIFKDYYFSEISTNQVEYVKTTVLDSRITWCSIDGQALPFNNNALQIVYMLAALHHLPELEASLVEIHRILKPGGYIICGFEPNRIFSTHFKKISLFSRRFLPTKGHSAADDEVAEGFTIDSLRILATQCNLTVLHIEPVWLFSGLAHYGLEFVYRVLRLKRRIRLPNLLEKMLISIDKLLFKIPGAKKISWSYTVIFQKQ